MAMVSLYSLPPCSHSSVKPREPCVPGHTLCLPGWGESRDETSNLKDLLGWQAKMTKAEAAPYHLSPIFLCQQDKLVCSGPFAAAVSLAIADKPKTLGYGQAPHAVLDAISLRFSPALQMATGPRQNLGRSFTSYPDVTDGLELGRPRKI